MIKAERPSSEHIGEIGESQSRAFLQPKFLQVSKPRPDAGIDVICSGFEHHVGQYHPPIHFQVKLGESYRAGIVIAARTLGFLISLVEHEPVFFIHYDSHKSDVTPDHFLVFHRWLVAHVEKVGNALECEGKVTILHKELQELRGKPDPLWAAVRDEIGRVTGRSNSMLVTRRPYFSGYHFYRYCQKVAQTWDLALLCRNRLVLRSSPYPALLLQELQNSWDKSEQEPSVASVLRMREYHPIARTPAVAIRRAQGRLIRALAEYDDRRDCRLSDNFDVVHVSAARVIASKYPRVVAPVLDVLRGWRKRSAAEVLVALQMAGTLSLFDASNKTAFLKSIRKLVRQAPNSCAGGLYRYRLLHHAHLVMGQIGEDTLEIRQAVRLAESTIELEFSHLAEYGWGVGPHVLTYYKRAMQRDTTRSTIDYDYNSGMYKVMEREIGAT